MSGPNVTTKVGDSISKHILTDQDGNLAAGLDTDGQAVSYVISRNYIWDSVALQWVREAQPSTGSGGTATHVIVDNPSLAVTGSFWQTTQPVSGAVTANAGNQLNTSALALESGGNLGAVATSLASYTTALDYDSSGNLIYAGKAVAGSAKSSASWQIKKLLYSGTNTTDIQYAGGTTSYNNAWTNRTSLVYS